MPDDIFIPEVARMMAADLTRDTGVKAIVRKYVTGYLLEHASEDVRLTVRYKIRKGKWSWAGSTLTVKGERQQLLAHGYDDYVQIFKQGHRDKMIIADSPVIEQPVYEPADEEDAPPSIRKELNFQRREGGKHGIDPASVTLHRFEDLYILTCRGPGLTVNMTYSKHADKGWHACWDRRVVLAFIGEGDVFYDVTENFATMGFDIVRLITALGHELPQTDIPRQIHHAAEPKRLNSVEVRRTSVIRV